MRACVRACVCVCYSLVPFRTKYKILADVFKLLKVLETDGRTEFVWMSGRLVLRWTTCALAYLRAIAFIRGGKLIYALSNV